MKYNKQKAIKYFIEQKVVEILIGLIIIAAIIFIPYLLGNFIGDNMDEICSSSLSELDVLGLVEIQCSNFGIWLEGVVYIVIISVILYLVGIIICAWFSRNWKKAKEKARE